MHRACHRDMACLRIVTRGIVDSVGLYVRPHDSDYEMGRFSMRMLGLEHLAERSFLEVSSGEQRLVLLARAFVKDPDLLILDEPLHGFDNWDRRLVKDIIDTYCRRRNKTLIMVSHYEDELPANINHRLVLRRECD